jgi:hypothetical protein
MECKKKNPTANEDLIKIHESPTTNKMILFFFG